MKKKHKKVLIRLICAAVIFALALALRAFVPPLVFLALMLTSYAVIGWDILWRAVRGIAHGQLLDENFLMALATVGAMFTGEYPEAVFVMMFYQLGELFQGIAVDKSRRSISSLMEIRPDSATVERDGEQLTVDPFEVSVGELIIIRPGERVPLDGVIEDGETTLDTVALTGESVPAEAGEGDGVLSGCVNLTGLIRVRVTKEFSESTVSRILELVENSASVKSKSERFITRFARVYTPAVVAAALVLAVIPPLFLGIGDWSVWKSWIYRAMSFLVVSCPCALVISVPLSFFGGVGGLSRKGVLVKGAGYIETLAECTTVVFDKTGTLTKGRFEVTDGDAQALSLAASAEYASNHPVAAAIRAAAGEAPPPESAEELAGFGVRAVIDGSTVCVGNAGLMQKENVPFEPYDGAATAVYVSKDGGYVGRILLSDAPKEDSARAIAELRAEGVTRIVMLTGDKRQVAEETAKTLGIDDFHAELLPADKVEAVESLLGNGKLIFVGDGINDAPVLARADVGVAMGALGSDAAIEAADVVLMDDKPSGIALAIRAARKTLRIVRENVVFVLAVKLLVLALVALGLTGMWAAVFADVGVCVLAILNAMRALRAGGQNVKADS